MSFFLAPLGVMGSRIVFAHLLILALLLTLLRSRMQESQLWVAAKRLEEKKLGSAALESTRLRKLLVPKHLRSMAFLIGMYGIWNLWAGTIGLFFPYILRTVGGQSQEMAVALQGVGLLIGIASLVGVFMRFSDHVNHRLLFGISALSQIIGTSLLAIFPLTRPVVLIFLLLAYFGYVQAFYQLWSAELFPTLLRSTAQGITFAVVRIGLGFWSLFVPILAATEFATLAWILTGFLIVSSLIGVIWVPRNEGKSLEEIESGKNAEVSEGLGVTRENHEQHSLTKTLL
jgi:inositol transporter-like SP family MFS transporter